jgi:hypothetical protein
LNIVESHEEWDNEGGNIIKTNKKKELRFILETLYFTIVLPEKKNNDSAFLEIENKTSMILIKPTLNEVEQLCLFLKEYIDLATKVTPPDAKENLP